MFSLSGAVEIFRRYILIRTDIIQKTVDGCPCVTFVQIQIVFDFKLNYQFLNHDQFSCIYFYTCKF